MYGPLTDFFPQGIDCRAHQDAAASGWVDMSGSQGSVAIRKMAAKLAVMSSQIDWTTQSQRDKRVI
jgi:hypothetical protein